MSVDFVLPDLGEGIAEAQIVRVLIKPGDHIAEDQYLVEVETDKAAVEIPSPYAGIATDIHVDEGQTVNVGDVIVTFDEVEAKGSKAAKTSGGSTRQPPPRRAPDAPAEPKVPQSEAPRAKTTVAAAPAVRKLAREKGIDLDQVTGSGPGGRITRDDLERHGSGVAGAPSDGAVVAPPRPSAEVVATPGTAGTDKWGSVHREPFRQIRKTIAKQMSRSAFTIPHVTHFDEADITELDRMRRDLNEATGGEPKLTVLTFLIRAVCIAMRKFPIFNASFDEEGGQIVYKDYVNMGIAVDTPRGLIVPVIRNTETLTVRGIAAALRAIADRTRSNRFEIEDLRGGTFTITNVGALGGVFSTPIINHPEVAILGLGRSRDVAVFEGEKLTRALMLPLSLSFDHRATDGANAARFTREVISYLETPAKFMLE